MRPKPELHHDEAMPPRILREAPRIPRTKIAVVVAIGLAQALTLGSSTVILRNAVDALWRLDEFEHPGQTYKLCGALVLSLSVYAWLRALEFAASERMGAEYVGRLRMVMCDHLQALSPRQLQRRSTGGILLRLTGDLTMLQTWVSRGVAIGIISLTVLVGGTGFLLALDPLIGLTVVTTTFAGAALSFTAGQRVRRTTRIMRTKRSALVSDIEEKVNALAVVQAFGRVAGESARISRHNDSLTGSLVTAARARARLRLISGVTTSLTVGATLAVGAFALSRGRTSVGVIVAAMTLARHMTGPARRLALSHEYWQRARVSRSKIADFLAIPAQAGEAPGLATLRAPKGRVEFENLCVHGALVGVTAVVPPGEIVAIIGPPGAGKTTLLWSVARLVEPDGGRVLIDGQPLGDFSRQSVRRHVGIVSADLPLMRGTIRRNLTYRDPGASEAEIWRVLMTGRIDRVVDQLPDGLNSWIIQGGRNLSAGQRQQIALGRATMGNPRILLLDEPTAHLDVTSKDLFRKSLAHHRGTVLWVTHDPAEIAIADQVWMMNKGRVVEQLSGDAYRDRLWLAGQKGERWTSTARA